MTVAILVHINPAPGTWTEAARDVVFSLGGEVLECTPMSWEVSGSHLDTAAIKMQVSKSVGHYARVTCFEVKDGRPVAFEGSSATLLTPR